MIIVELIGGLGNQLFQYAIGKRLAVINDTELVLDISSFEKYKLHNYGLMNFNIDAKIASPELLRKISNPVSRFFSKTILIKEKDYSFDHSILKK